MKTKHILITLLLQSFLCSPLLPAFADTSRRISAHSAQKESERRIALIIGNGAYKESPLANPANDADSMAAALQKAGFEVILKKNLNRREMRGAIREFGDKLAATGGMGLFYYAGHGMAVQGNNYLIPVGADIQRANEIEDEAISAASILKTMDDAKNGLNLIVLDACRNNPFASRFRSGDKGLATMNPPTGVLVLYATSPGSVARDGSGINGVFTKHFIDKMNLEGMDIRIMIGKVTEAVRKETGNDQSPYMEGMITGEFSFRVAQGGASEALLVAAVDTRAFELQYWQSAEKSNTSSAYRAYLNKYPIGDFAELAKDKLQILNDLVTRDDSIVRAEKERLVKEKEDAGKRARRAEAVAAGGTSLQPFKDPTTGMEFVPVKGGCFQMGDTFGDGDKDEKPVHEVCLSDFTIGKYEVTVGQYLKFTNQVGANYPVWMASGNDYNIETGMFGFWYKELGSALTSENYPIVGVSWTDAAAFAKWLSEKSGKLYRLPTEAEWEYAARSGGKREQYAGGNDVDAVAWYKSNSDGKTHPVGQKQANGLGIYDMSGNVWEWVLDWKGNYSSDRQQNPQGPTSGSDHVYRGDSWLNDAKYARVTFRGADSADRRLPTLGFRLVSPAM